MYILKTMFATWTTWNLYSNSWKQLKDQVMQVIQLFIQTSFPFKQVCVIDPYHDHDLPYLSQISFQRPNFFFTELAKYLKCLGLCYKFIYKWKLLLQHHVQPTQCCLPISITVGIGDFFQSLMSLWLHKWHNESWEQGNFGSQLETLFNTQHMSHFFDKKKETWPVKRIIQKCSVTIPSECWLLFSFLKDKREKNGRIRSHTGIWKYTYDHCFFLIAFAFYGKNINCVYTE